MDIAAVRACLLNVLCILSKEGYDPLLLQGIASLVVNPFTVGNHASIFNQFYDVVLNDGFFSNQSMEG